jgi:hypothetical protein
MNTPRRQACLQLTRSLIAAYDRGPSFPLEAVCSCDNAECSVQGLTVRFQEEEAPPLITSPLRCRSLLKTFEVLTHEEAMAVRRLDLESAR